jgi:hypothetical protein
MIADRRFEDDNARQNDDDNGNSSGHPGIEVIHVLSP